MKAAGLCTSDYVRILRPGRCVAHPKNSHAYSFPHGYRFIDSHGVVIPENSDHWGPRAATGCSRFPMLVVMARETRRHVSSGLAAR
jgi:hypothetical protein